ncbi:helix-turn-helix transcriptional regulator [Paenibacillus sp. OK003]|uniref:AraC family transcriptional regulator n=1 Tax=Paenibacillus sp. OK003 TaxID=1884380 RepID=UPI0008CED8BE|nr:helix-turn-helix transcriptional regulator [Paenibacillus sp. OK003]SEK58260.1 transcriptional regulator, AraC family [Paenibacillus sp. OK003]
MRSFYLPDLSELRFFCFPHSVGNYTQPDEHNINRPEGVRDFSLHYIAEGSGYIELDNTKYELGKGNVFLHVPNDRMRYYLSEEDPWNIYWIQFYGNTLPAFFLDNGYFKSSVWTQSNASLLESAFEELLDEIERYNFLRPSRISALNYSVLIEFMSHSIPLSSYRNINNLEKITALLPEMQKNAHLPFELEGWANQVGLTPNYFCSLFKKATKMTPVSYITKCRIQRSKLLLLSNPSMPIKEVAILSGYPGNSYFNKKFMESEGKTPAEFRRIHLKA